MSFAYRVTHRTEYGYERDVSESYGQLHLLPRELPGWMVDAAACASMEAGPPRVSVAANSGSWRPALGFSATISPPIR